MERNWWLFRTADNRYIVGSGDKELTFPLTEEDARLLVAAPSMLKTLESIACYPPTSSGAIEGLKEIARTAVGKARGR